jgi:hypothetical protein
MKEKQVTACGYFSREDREQKSEWVGKRDGYAPDSE